MGKCLIAALAVVLASGALLSACGGSGDSKPLTQKEFVSQGNEICKAATKEREEVSKEVLGGGGSGGAKEAEEVAGKLLVPVRKMTEELAALTPPEKQQAQAKEMVSEFEAGISKVESEPAGGETASAFAKANLLASEVGLTSCSV